MCVCVCVCVCVWKLSVCQRRLLIPDRIEVVILSACLSWMRFSVLAVCRFSLLLTSEFPMDPTSQMGSWILSLLGKKCFFSGTGRSTNSFCEQEPKKTKHILMTREAPPASKARLEWWVFFFFLVWNVSSPLPDN
jgi:hypothetical protein